MLNSNYICNFAAMKRDVMNNKFLLGLLLLLLSACGKDDGLLNKMEQIKLIGNAQPELAISMLDSIQIDVVDASEYARMKYELLSIRLRDKADIIPTSDVAIKKLVSYFEQKGTLLEKQEVHYYAGSVYRDLDDAPRALEHFFNSLEYAEKASPCDSLTLRNTYSNLQYIYYRVQDYADALVMARHELSINKQLNDDLLTSYMHMASSFVGLDSLKQAEKACDSAFEEIRKSEDDSAYQAALILLLCQYSQLDCMIKAKQVRTRIITDPLYDYDAFSCIAFAEFYESVGKKDSAILYLKRVLDDNNDMYNMYNAAERLYSIHYQRGDLEKANEYANIFIQLSNSINFEKRQTEAAMVNNLYKYYRDAEAERAVMEEGERTKQRMRMVCLLSAIGFLSCGIFYYYRKNKHLRLVLEKNMELRLARQKNQQLLDELNETEKELESKSKELGDKVKQNKLFLRMMHKSEMELNAEDVIRNIHEASIGRHQITIHEWQQLLAAVDRLYPDFKDALVTRTESLSEEQMRFCYLLRIGLSSSQIQNVTDMSRATVWRWTKKYEEIVK